MTFSFYEETERGANYHIRILANEMGIEGHVESSGDPRFPFACVFRKIDRQTHHKIQSYFEEWVGPE